VVGGQEVWCGEKWGDSMWPVKRRGPARGRGFQGRIDVVSGRRGIGDAVRDVSYVI
jgi:hypothetical protein